MSYEENIQKVIIVFVNSRVNTIRFNQENPSSQCSPLTELFLDHSQCCDVNVIHVDIPSDFARIFILHENIYATRMLNIWGLNL